MTDVKPCPFCGSKAEISTSSIAEQVYCPNCGAFNIWHPEAVKHWNKRKKNTDMKPCPVCGGAGMVMEYCGTFYVRCKKCGLTSGRGQDEAQAKAAWNRRSSPAEKELKPCPFCGGEAEVKTVPDGKAELYGVFCKADARHHEHSIDNYYSRQEAVADWNRRVGDEEMHSS